MADSPVAIVCVGMAGSGKTTFMQRINSYLHTQKTPPYVLNLDPAVKNVPFDSNIDIRDSINYKEVMKQYNLGPNGGILTSLNLFATKIDQILSLLEKRTTPDPSAPPTVPIKNIIVDTPGQIEVFVWSASGTILLESLASTFPTVIAYIIDTPRTSSVSTFMSNMLYACSILYKTKLPMVLVFNKTDVQDASFAKEWMTDFEAFQAALRDEEDRGSFGGFEGGEGGASGSGYMGSLLNSMSLVLEEFYRHLSVVGVSSMTGQGIDEFFEAIRLKADEYNSDYKPELLKRQEQRRQDRTQQQDKDLGRMMRDMNVDPAAAGRQTTPKGAARNNEPSTLSDVEDDEGNSEQEGDLPGAAEDETEGPDGLEARYKRALADQTNTADQDTSFARYLARSNAG